MYFYTLVLLAVMKNWSTMQNASPGRKIKVEMKPMLQYEWHENVPAFVF